ncbi:MAG: site-specific integrase, partial [Solirubrobacteraceae bacterium]
MQPNARTVLDFLAYLELERGLARNTLAAYRTDLLQLTGFLDRRGVDLLAATHGDLAAFLADRSASGGPDGGAVAPATTQRKLACMR